MRKLLLIGLLCLAACTQQWWNDRLSSREQQTFAMAVVEQLRSRQIDQLANEAQPELRQQLPNYVKQVAPTLALVAGPFKLQTVGSSHFSGGLTTETFVIQGGSGNRWAIVRVVLQGSDNSLKLAGLKVIPFDSDPSKLDDFEIGRRGIVGYLWLLMMVASISTCLFATYLIWRRPWLNRRWLWTLGSLFGFAGIHLNWSTGQWAIVLWNVSLLGAGTSKMGVYAPWILKFSIPVIAIVVIVRWFRYERRAFDQIDGQDA